MDFEARVTGLAEFQRGLMQFNRRLSERVNRLALRQGANFIAKKVRAAAPVKTGRLRRAIKIKNSSINRINRNGMTGVYLTVSPGKNRADPRGAWYGKFVEVGYKKGSRAITGRQAVQMGIISQQQLQGRRAQVAMQARPGRVRQSIRYRAGGQQVTGQHFVRDTFESNKQQAAELIIRASEMAARQLAREIGFTTT